MFDIRKCYTKIYWATFTACLSFLAFIYIQYCGLSTIFSFVALGISFVSMLCLQALAVQSLIIIQGKLPVRLFCLGVLIIWGGASVDIIATVKHSPSLDLEANLIIRFFLENHFSLKMVYGMALCFQVLMASIITLLWAAFLKNYPGMLQGISPRGFINTFFSLYGARKVDWFQALLGKKDPFMLVNSTIPLLVGVYLYRWYLALEWFHIVPISRVLVPSVICLLSLGIYSLISYKKVSRSPSRS